MKLNRCASQCIVTRGTLGEKSGLLSGMKERRQVLLGPEAVITEEKQLLGISWASSGHHGPVLLSQRMDPRVSSLPQVSRAVQTWLAGVGGVRAASRSLLEVWKVAVISPRERRLIWHSWHCPLFPCPSRSCPPGPREPCTTWWRVVICFCPINFLKGQKRIAGLEGRPGKHTDEEVVA